MADAGKLAARCLVERRDRFRDLYEQKERTGANEVLDVVTEYDDLWRQTRATVENMGGAYRYSFWRQLPSISAVRESVRLGRVATTRRWDSTFLLEHFADEQMVRVVV